MKRVDRNGVVWTGSSGWWRCEYGVVGQEGAHNWEARRNGEVEIARRLTSMRQAMDYVTRRPSRRAASGRGKRG